MAYTSTIPPTGTFGGSGTKAVGKKALDSNDFIKLLITQLKNQDPTQPMKNEELLAQVTQIGQLQSQTELSSTLKNLVLQNQVGSAGNLIGKTVQGLDDKNESVTGQVTRIRVEDNQVKLELDNGKLLGLERVSQISSVGSAAATSAPVSNSTNNSKLIAQLLGG